MTAYVKKRWAEIYQCWYDLIRKDKEVDAVTAGHFWIDLSNIAEGPSL
jgi:hypothetical protein